jgi:hypothetical protein
MGRQRTHPLGTMTIMAAFPTFLLEPHSPRGDRVVSYTGLLRDEKMETAWFVVSDKSLSAKQAGEPAELKNTNWWRVVSTNVGTFEKLLIELFAPRKQAERDDRVGRSLVARKHAAFAVVLPINSSQTIHALCRSR